MNFLDWLIFGTFAVGIVYGLIKGAVKELITIASIVIYYMFGSRLYDIFANYLISKGHITDEITAKVVAFMSVFLFFCVAAILIGNMIKNIMKVIALGWLDRSFGAALGFIKASVLWGILLIFLAMVVPSNSAVMQNSVLSPKILKIFNGMTSLIPKSLKDNFYQKYGELKSFGFGLPKKLLEEKKKTVEQDKKKLMDYLDSVKGTETYEKLREK